MLVLNVLTMVPGTGLEPARLAALDPKSSASANSAIPAFAVVILKDWAHPCGHFLLCRSPRGRHYLRWLSAGRQAWPSVGLTGALMGFPSRVGAPPPFSTGSKQSLHRPLSFSHCPWMNPNLLHSRMIFWQAALFSAAAWFCTGRFRGGTAAVCALALPAIMVATRKLPATKIRVVVRITLLQLEVGNSSGYEFTLCRGFAPW